MLRPSGSAWMATTSAPVAASSGPASALAAPLAASTTIAQPVEAAPVERGEDVVAVGRAVLDVDQLGRVAGRRRQVDDVGLDALLDVVGQLRAAAVRTA